MNWSDVKSVIFDSTELLWAQEKLQTNWQEAFNLGFYYEFLTVSLPLYFMNLISYKFLLYEIITS